MFLQVLEFVLLAPFKGFGKLVDAFFFPPKLTRFIEEENQDLQKENERIRKALFSQVNQSSTLESELIRMDREHQRDAQKLKEYYEAKIRDVERKFAREKEKKEIQHAAALIKPEVDDILINEAVEPREPQREVRDQQHGPGPDRPIQGIGRSAPPRVHADD